MPKWIVMSKPAPLGILIEGMVLTVAIIVPLEILIHWLGFGQSVVRYAVTPVGVLGGLYYIESRRQGLRNKQP